MLRTLFSIFKSKGIQFKHTRDFNNDEEFHAVLKKQWEKETQKDDTFGTGVRTSLPDLEADRKIHLKYDKGLFDPFSISNGTLPYEHRKWYCIFVLGRYWLLRGRKEVVFLKWSQVKMCSGTENGEPVEYIEIVQQFNKSCQLNITNTTVRSLTDIPPRMYPNPNDPLCPVKFLKFIRTLCCPEQECVLCRPYNTKQMKTWKKKDCLTYTTPTSLSAKIKLMELIKISRSSWNSSTGRDAPTTPTIIWASQQLCLMRNREYNISSGRLRDTRMQIRRRDTLRKGHKQCKRTLK
jgi:hypothetical protein